MKGLAGTGALIRALLRRDRTRILVWIGSIVGLTLSSAAGVEGIYPTDADLRQAAALVEGNATAIAFNGPAQGLDSLGGRIAFETGSFTLALVGLMSLFMLTRNTRAEEESGRLELVRATVVGRHAPMNAALTVVGAMNVLTGTAVTVGFVALDLPVAGSVSFGVSVAVVGLAFTAISAVTAQVSDNTRVASGLAGLSVGLAYTLRAIGDVGGGGLSWLSPIGWGQKLRPFAGEVWWPLVVALTFSGGCLVAAAVLASHRDLGGGLVSPHAGRASAAPSLGHPVGFAVRLHRGAVAAWGAGVLVLGSVYGSLADDIEDFIADLDDSVRDIIVRSGNVDISDAFFGTTLLTLALVGAGFAVQTIVRLRSEEVALRAEPLLATPVSRSRWVAGHVAVALGGSVIVLGAGGIGLGLAYGLTVHDAGEVPRTVAEALAYLPATGVLIGLALALFGWLPRATAAVWAALVGCVAIGFFGELLDLPGWATDLSPFEHTPLVPAETMRLAPVAVLSATAIALGGVGLWGFRRRDLALP